MRLVHELGSSVTGRDVLGRRGADLAQLADLDLPIAPGFVIATAAWHLLRLSTREGTAAALREQVDAALRALQRRTGQQLDNPEDPLLLAVTASLAGRETVPEAVVLAIGLSDRTVAGLAARTDQTAAWWAYRNLVRVFCAQVFAIGYETIDRTLAAAGPRPEPQVRALKALLADHGHELPQTARGQLELLVSAMLLATAAPSAIVIQAGAPGMAGFTPPAGTVYTRDPAVGAPRLVGDIHRLGALAPTAIRSLPSVEAIHRDMCEIQFTVQGDELFVHDARPGSRSGPAAIQIAVDLVDGGLIDSETALARIPLSALEDVARPVVAATRRLDVVARGEVASPGVAAGTLLRLGRQTSPTPEQLAGCIIVTADAGDVGWGFCAAAGAVITGGSAAAAAAAPVLARRLRRPAICTQHELDLPDGAEVTLDATNGTLYLGTAELAPPTPDVALGRVLGWLSDGSARPTRAVAPADAPVIDLPTDLALAADAILAVRRAGPDARHWLRLPATINGDLQPPPGPYAGVVAPPQLRWAGELLAWRLSRAGRPAGRDPLAAGPGF